MRALLLVAALTACGGGASIDARTSAVIVSSSCTRTSASSFDADVQYRVELVVGQAITPEIDFFSDSSIPGGFLDESIGCGGWTPFGDDTCVRDPGQPPAVTIVHNYAQDIGEASLPVPTTLFITANPLDAPGSFSIGSGDSEEIDCQ